MNNQVARQSSRAPASRGGGGGNKKSGGGDSSDSDFEDKKGKGKKTATKRSYGRVQGRFAAVVRDFPVEVIDRVISYCDAKTLHSLSRTSPPFREMLCADNAQSRWEAAFAALGLKVPFESTDWSYTRWATLLFDRKCQRCLTGPALSIQYEPRLRLCKSCMASCCAKDNNTVQDMSLRADKIHPAVWRCCTGFFYASEKQWGYYLPLLLQKNKKLLELEADDVQEFGDVAYASRSYKWGDKRNDAQFVEGSGVVKYVTDQLKLKEDNKKDGEMIKAWEAAVLNTKAAEKVPVSNDRRAAVTAKLLDLGYEQRDIDAAAAGHGKNHFQKAQALTDKVWNTAKGAIVSAVETAKMQRELRERMGGV